MINERDEWEPPRWAVNALAMLGFSVLCLILWAIVFCLEVSVRFHSPL